MRKLFTVLALLVFVAGAWAVSRDEAYSKVTQELLAGNLDGKAIDTLSNVVSADSSIADMHGQTFKAPSNSWFFLVDDHFTANWDHACRYVFVDTVTGDMTVYPANAPIRDSSKQLNLFTSTISEGPARYPSYDLPRVMPKEMLSAGKGITLGNNPTGGYNYALLLSGGYNSSNNHGRYYGDVEYMIKTLKQKYGYTNPYIRVSMSDGLSPATDQHVASGYINSIPDIDGDGYDETTHDATLAGLTAAVGDLAGIMTSNDNLFMFITDHGGSGGGANCTVNLWNAGAITYTSLRTLIDTIPKASFNMCNEVCYSGGAVNGWTGAPNTVIATACNNSESSWARVNHPYDYNEFTFWWTGAVMGQTCPDHEAPIDCSAADTDGDGLIDMSEAFVWADDHDAASEHPQYYDNPSGFGATLCLFGLEEATDVNVTSFAASGRSDRIVLNWSATNVGLLAGFNIYRTTAGNNRYERINQTPIVGSSPYSFSDTSVEKGIKYSYKLEAVESTGFRSSFGPVVGRTTAGLPTNFSLGVRPNPAHGHATIDYSVASTFGNTDTSIRICDLSGRTVKILHSGPVAPGSYNLQWDGTDASGSSAPAGVYICVMNSGGQNLTKRIVFTR